METYKEVLSTWQKAWEVALSLWTKFARLREPKFIFSEKERQELKTGRLFAMIRLTDHTIIVDLPKIMQLGLSEYPVEILAHEIGHHIVYPSNLTDMGRMLLRIKKALTFPSLTSYTNFIGNIYTDLLINNKLKLEFGLNIDKVYKKFQPDKVDLFWNFYMRIYELLWALPKNTLTKGEISNTIEADAGLGNRLIRNFAIDWISGAGKFACLCIPYLMENNSAQTQNKMSYWLDNSTVNDSNYQEIPSSLFDFEEIEKSDIQHPSMDPNLSEIPIQENATQSQSARNVQANQSNTRSPSEIREILNQLGVQFNLTEFLYSYYKQLALPHLIPFPKKFTSQAKEEILEGSEIWDISDPFENINWFQTALKSPIPIPGYSILEDYYGEIEGAGQKFETIDLDIYIDSSGSMPNPSYKVSYLTLAGAIILLSALRANSKVQATLWSWKDLNLTTKEFIEDEKKLMQIVTGYLGGGTQFPLHIFEETYSTRKPTDRKVHILIISDDGVDTILDKYNKLDGYDISKMALEKAGGGGTMVLNLPYSISKYPKLKLLKEQGWKIHRVTQWEELVQFARKFVEENYKNTF